MKLKNFTKFWYALLIVPVLFVTSCKEDPVVEPVVPVSSFQFEVDATNFLQVTFSNFSQNATSYAWDFGDQVGTSTDESPVYTYTASGSYTVKLTVTDAAGASAESTKDIDITDPDVALTLLAGSDSKTWKLFREGTSMQLGTPDNPGAHWEGLTNDGSRNCLYEQTFTFQRDGAYVFDDNGAFWGEYGVFNDTDFYEVCFEAVPANMLNLDGLDVSAWLSGTHQYDYEASTGTVTLSGLGAWIGIPKLGTAVESTVPLEETSFEISITEETGYDLMNLVFTHGGNIWSFVYVNYSNAALEPPLVAINAGFDVSTSGLTATFTNTSSGGTSFAWEFGDGGSSTEENPSHAYAADGTYSVTLTATDGDDSGTKTKDVIIDTANPAEAAPSPTEDAANVISIYSDAYTDIDGVNYNPGWGQATVLTEEVVAGDNVLKLAGLNYQGIDWAGTPLDVSSKTMLHIDIWAKNVETINFSLISVGPLENPVLLTTEAGTWVSFDIALSEYNVPSLLDVIQFKFDDAATGTSPTFFVDNMYFY